MDKVTAEEYIKEKWCDPIWFEWVKRDVLEVMEEYATQKQESLIKELIEKFGEVVESFNNEAYDNRGDKLLENWMKAKSEAIEETIDFLQSKLPPKEKGEENEF